MDQVHLKQINTVYINKLCKQQVFIYNATVQQNIGLIFCKSKDNQCFCILFDKQNETYNLLDIPIKHYTIVCATIHIQTDQAIICFDNGLLILVQQLLDKPQYITHQFNYQISTAIFAVNNEILLGTITGQVLSFQSNDKKFKINPQLIQFLPHPITGIDIHQLQLNDETKKTIDILQLQQQQQQHLGNKQTNQNPTQNQNVSRIFIIISSILGIKIIHGIGMYASEILLKQQRNINENTQVSAYDYTVTIPNAIRIYSEKQIKFILDDNQQLTGWVWIFGQVNQYSQTKQQNPNISNQISINDEDGWIEITQEEVDEKELLKLFSKQIIKQQIEIQCYICKFPNTIQKLNESYFNIQQSVQQYAEAEKQFTYIFDQLSQQYQPITCEQMIRNIPTLGVVFNKHEIAVVYQECIVLMSQISNKCTDVLLHSSILQNNDGQQRSDYFNILGVTSDDNGSILFYNDQQLFSFQFTLSNKYVYDYIHNKNFLIAIEQAQLQFDKDQIRYLYSMDPININNNQLIYQTLAKCQYSPFQILALSIFTKNNDYGDIDNRQQIEYGNFHVLQMQSVYQNQLIKNNNVISYFYINFNLVFHYCDSKLSNVNTFQVHQQTKQFNEKSDQNIIKQYEEILKLIQIAIYCLMYQLLILQNQCVSVNKQCTQDNQNKNDFKNQDIQNNLNQFLDKYSLIISTNNNINLQIFDLLMYFPNFSQQYNILLKLINQYDNCEQLVQLVRVYKLLMKSNNSDQDIFVTIKFNILDLIQNTMQDNIYQKKFQFISILLEYFDFIYILDKNCFKTKIIDYIENKDHIEQLYQQLICCQAINIKQQFDIMFQIFTNVSQLQSYEQKQYMLKLLIQIIIENNDAVMQKREQDAKNKATKINYINQLNQFLKNLKIFKLNHLYVINILLQNKQVFHKQIIQLFEQYHLYLEAYQFSLNNKDYNSARLICHNLIRKQHNAQSVTFENQCAFNAGNKIQQNQDLICDQQIFKYTSDDLRSMLMNFCTKIIRNKFLSVVQALQFVNQVQNISEQTEDISSQNILDDENIQELVDENQLLVENKQNTSIPIEYQIQLNDLLQSLHIQQIKYVIDNDLKQQIYKQMNRFHQMIDQQQKLLETNKQSQQSNQQFNKFNRRFITFDQCKLLCAVCKQSKINSLNNLDYSIANNVIVFQCHHVFHVECILNEMKQMNKFRIQIDTKLLNMNNNVSKQSSTKPNVNEFDQQTINHLLEFVSQQCIYCGFITHNMQNIEMDLIQ